MVSNKDPEYIYNGSYRPMRVIVEEPKDREYKILKLLSDKEPHSLPNIIMEADCPSKNARKCLRYYCSRNYVLLYKTEFNWRGRLLYYKITDLGLQRLKELSVVE